MNRTNLDKLATYLEGLPADYRHFGMSAYMQSVDRAHFFINQAPLAGSCGTIACAVGHGPAAGIPADEGTVWWTDYGEKAFQLAPEEWAWCFDSQWTVVDNTPHGAAKRIRYLLDHGLPEDDFEQRHGATPYMFASDPV
jgi:hypothetical protein